MGAQGGVLGGDGASVLPRRRRDRFLGGELGSDEEGSRPLDMCLSPSSSVPLKVSVSLTDDAIYAAFSLDS